MSLKNKFQLYLLISILVFAAVGFTIVNFQQRAALDTLKINVTQELSDIRAKLESAINSELALTAGVAAFVAANPNVTQQEYTIFGKQLLSRKNIVKNIAAAKNMVISLIYPIEGNEAALGLDYKNTPSQWAAAKHAINEREIVMAGPLTLVQGGLGLIGRHPVFYNDEPDRLWGMVSIVLDYPQLINNVGIHQDPNLDIAIRGKDSLGENGDIFEGNAAIFDGNPIKLNVDLPFGNWIIAALPKQGWKTENGHSLTWTIVGLLWLLTAVLFYYRYQGAVAYQLASERLSQSERRFRTLFENHNAIMVMFDPIDGAIIDVNVAAVKFYGYRRSILKHMRIFDLALAPEETTRQQLKDLVNDKKMTFVATHKINHDHTAVVEFHSTPIEVDGRTIHFAIVYDITEREIVQAKLTQSATVFESAQEGVIITDSQVRILAVNKAFMNITGYQEDEVIGQGIMMLPSDKSDLDNYQQAWQVVERDGKWQGEIWSKRKDGTDFPAILSISAIYNEHHEITSYVGVFSDISILKQSEDQLKHLAHFDSLTELPNRTLLNSFIAKALARADRQRNRVACLFLDLDRFKIINDSMGHLVGDELLCAVAKRIAGRLRIEDQLARIGGDEFVVLISEVSNPPNLVSLATDLINELAKPFKLNHENEAFIGVSIGIATYPEDASNGEQLVANADAAMYKAKEAGRNTYSFYTESITQEANRKLTVSAQLRRALEKNEFVLHYQPQVNMTTNKVMGVEALVRWQHPEQGLLFPMDFIHIAEETGLIHDLSKWVLEKAACFLSELHQKGHHISMAVNISPRDFSYVSLVTEVAEIINKTQVPVAFLELEITESMLMQNADSAQGQLSALRDLGVQLAIDDFGTGYSSLAYLKNFPVNKLKIDRSFICDIPSDNADVEITNTVIAMAKNLHLSVIAEGVETESQRDFLVNSGCVMAQGYLYSKPIDEQALFEFIENSHSGTELLN